MASNFARKHAAVLWPGVKFEHSIKAAGDAASSGNAPWKGSRTEAAVEQRMRDLHTQWQLQGEEVRGALDELIGQEVRMAEQLSFRDSDLVRPSRAVLPSPAGGLDVSAESGYYGEGRDDKWGNLLLSFARKAKQQVQPPPMPLPVAKGARSLSCVFTQVAHDARELRATADWRAHTFSPLLLTHAGEHPVQDALFVDE